MGDFSVKPSMNVYISTVVHFRPNGESCPSIRVERSFAVVGSKIPHLRGSGLRVSLVPYPGVRVRILQSSVNTRVHLVYLLPCVHARANGIRCRHLVIEFVTVAGLIQPFTGKAGGVFTSLSQRKGKDGSLHASTLGFTDC